VHIINQPSVNLDANIGQADDIESVERSQGIKFPDPLAIR
jgi:hypothetical protein